MKYIIDLPDNCSWVQWVMTSDKDGHAFFDFKQPLDLTPLDNELEEAFQKGFEVGQHEATTLEYRQGLNDAWGTIIKIALIPYAERSEIFDGKQDILSIVQKFSPSEVAAKLREYEQQKANEIKVGDEVDYKGMTKYVVTGIVDDTICGFSLNGLWNANTIKEVTKTGRHFPQVAELLEAMKEGAE